MVIFFPSCFPAPRPTTSENPFGSTCGMYPESDHVSPPPSAHPSPTRAQPGSLPPAAPPTGHPLHTESGNGRGRCSTRRPSPSLGLHSHGSLRLHLPPTLALRGSAPAVPFAGRALLQAPLGFLTPRLMFSVHTTEQRGHSPRFPAPHGCSAS